MRKTLKRLIKRSLQHLGYTIQKMSIPKTVYKPTEFFTTHQALARCQVLKLKINTVIDVGASDGRWSKNCMVNYPDAHYLLVEAQNAHLEGLKHFKDSYNNVSFVLAAAGKENGTIYFNNAELFGGVASETPFEKNSIEVPVVSLDSEVEKRNLQPPFLLKLDTHGFEVPILEGAKKVISQASLIIIEAYNFNIEENSLCFWELCEYMGNLGFRPLEVVDLMAREYDQAFWQMDIFFISKNHPLFNYNKYK